MKLKTSYLLIILIAVFTWTVSSTTNKFSYGTTTRKLYQETDEDAREADALDSYNLQQSQLNKEAGIQI